MAGVAARLQIHNVQAPSKVEHAPPAGAHGLYPTAIAAHIDMRAIF